MAYDKDNLALIAEGVGGEGTVRLWSYRSTDDAATVDGANYITNGGSMGLKVGDLVFVTDTDASPPITTMHQVSATGDGTTDLNNLTTITQTDSD